MAPNPPSLFGKMTSRPSWETVFLPTQMGAGVAQPVSHFCKELFVMYLPVGSILFNSRNMYWAPTVWKAVSKQELWGRIRRSVILQGSGRWCTDKQLFNKAGLPNGMRGSNCGHQQDEEHITSTWGNVERFFDGHDCGDRSWISGMQTGQWRDMERCSKQNRLGKDMAGRKDWACLRRSRCWDFPVSQITQKEEVGS